MFIAAAAFILAAILYIIYKISPKLLFFILHLFCNLVISSAAIIGYNYIASNFDCGIGLNPFSALFCALLGIPGFIALAAARIFII